MGKKGLSGYSTRRLVALMILVVTIGLPAHAQTVCDAGACYPIPAPPSSPNCANVAIPAGHPTATVTGTVTDVRGIPLSNASVYWQYGCATSSSSGTFSILVWTDNAVTMTAVKDQYAYKSITKQNPIASWIFQLKFAITAVATPKGTNTTPRTITFTVYTTAPVANTHVELQLPGTWGTKWLSFVTSFQQPAGNWTKWSTTWSVPQGTADGAYVYTVCALDIGANGTCDGPLGVTLALGVETSDVLQRFYVDHVSPTLAPTSPLPNSNVDTGIGAIPIVLAAADDLSGIDVAVAVVTLQDTTAGTQPVVQPVTLDGGYLRTTSVTVTSGHAFAVNASVADKAGNLVSAAFTFRAVTLSVPQGSNRPVATIESTSTTDWSNTGMTRTFTFHSVPLQLSAVTATIHGPLAHAGVGHVAETADITQAKVHLYASDGSEIAGSPFNAPSSWATRVVYGQAVAFDASASAWQIPIALRLVTLPTLQFSTTNASAVRAVVEMTSSATVTVPLCADPTLNCSSTSYATTDPVPFFISPGEALTLLDQIQKTKDTIARQFCELESTVQPPDIPTACYFAYKWHDVIPGLIHVSIWNAVEQGWDLSTLPGPAGSQPIYDYVYQNTKDPVVIPGHYWDRCGGYAISLCQYSQDPDWLIARLNEQDGTDYCVTTSGARKDAQKPCSQWVYIFGGESDHRRDYEDGSNPYVCDNNTSAECSPVNGKSYHWVWAGLHATYGLSDEVGPDYATIKDRLIFGIDNSKYDEHAIWGIARQSSLHGYRDYAYSEMMESENGGYYCERVKRDGVHSSFSDYHEIVQGGSSDQWVGHSGVDHIKLRQITHVDSANWGCGLPVGPGDDLQNRLYGAEAGALLTSTEYYGNRVSIGDAVMGHRKQTYDWDFGCGVSISYPFPVGCGWSLGYDTTEVWEADSGGMSITW